MRHRQQTAITNNITQKTISHQQHETDHQETIINNKKETKTAQQQQTSTIANDNEHKPIKMDNKRINNTDK